MNVVPRWFCRASRYRFSTVFWMRLTVLGTTVSQNQFALFSSVMRSCPHAHALPVNWSSPKSTNLKPSLIEDVSRN